jgi:hypothetical protein
MFKMMAEAAVDPVLGEVCRRILLDESRHMGFGMLALPKIVREATEGERREMEDFTCLAVEKVLTGFFPLEAYQDLGFSPAQIQEVRAYRRDAASRNDYAAYRKYFRPRHAHRHGEQPRAHQPADRARAAAPRRPRRRATRRRLER